MPTTIILHGDEIVLLIAGILSLIVLAAVWGGTFATQQKPARPVARFAKLTAWYRWNFTNRKRAGRHYATA